jgi:Ca2+-binding RTX toxin-like protein
MAYIKATNPAGEWLDFLDGITDDGDTIEGGIGGDHIFAGNGNDFIKGGGGADFLSGGAGRDTASYADSGEAVKVNLETNANKGGTAEGDYLIGIEDVIGSKFNDKLTGNWADNMLDGGAGNDVLKGGGGADTLKGGIGDDVLETDGLQDHLIGGAGIDTLVFRSDYGMYVNLEAGIIQVRGWGMNHPHPPNCFVTEVENVIGTSYGDKIFGNDLANSFSGGGGDDSLAGMDGNDTLNGEGGNDKIVGGTGVDKLTGGSGQDTFVFFKHIDSVMGAASMDTTMDFQQGQDKIDLTDMEPGLGDLLILNNQNIDGVSCSYVGLDYDDDGTLGLYEFCVMVKMAPDTTLGAADVLI